MTPPTGRVKRARAYYRALDEDDYDLLESLLASGFVHERPDRTLEGRDRFVRFMREERPMTDTSHPIDGVYHPADADPPLDDDAGTAESEGAAEVAARGRLLDSDGERLTGFVDVFSFEGEKIAHLRTYVD